MTGFSDAWKKAGQPPDEFDPPNGPHYVTIIEASAFHGRDNRAWAKAVLQIVGTPDAGRQFDHFMNLNNQVGLRIARESLVTYGLDPAAMDDPDADIETLHTAMQPLVGSTAYVTVTHKDGFRNIRVDRAQVTRSVDTPQAPAKAGFEQASTPAGRDFGEAPF